MASLGLLITELQTHRDKVLAMPRLLLFIHQMGRRTDAGPALGGAQGAPGKEGAGLEFSRSPAKRLLPQESRVSPQVAGPREPAPRSYLVLLRNPAETTRKPALATGGPDSKDDFEPQGRGSEL